MKQLNDYFELTESERGSAIWRYFDSQEGPTWKLYVEDSKISKQIRSWQGAQPGATYFRPDSIKCGEDFVVPKRLLRRALKLIGISLQKRKLTEAELINLHQGEHKLRGKNFKSDFALDFSKRKTADERSQADPVLDTPSDTGAFLGQDFASKVEGETP